MSARALILSLLLATSYACTEISCPPAVTESPQTNIEIESDGLSFLTDPLLYDSIEIHEDDRYGSVGAILDENANIFCSGVLIHKRVILTSQHCMFENACNKMFMTQNGQILSITEVIGAPRYNPGLPFNDLAICILEADCIETPAKLAHNPFELLPGEELTTVGWSLGKKKVSQPKVVKYYGSLIEEGGQVMRMLATKGSVFYGDSGGAVFEDNGLLAGIICFFGLDKETGVIIDNGAIRVDYYKNWIDQVLKERCMELPNE